MIESARERFREENFICFTSDLDWAPEVAIEGILKLFLERGIRPTMFVTHPSQVINKYKDEIDIGIHPNFIQPSSQGNNIDDIIDYCVGLAPETRVFRAHRWYSSNDIYDRLLRKGFTYESNLCTSMDLVDPYIQRSGMISFPVFFEDGAYIMHSDKIDFNMVKQKFMQNGLKVVNIHPMHFALNTPYFQYTRQIKDKLTRNEWVGMDENMLEDLKYKGKGITNFIIQLMDLVKVQNIKIITLEQAYKMCI
jgi:hypothetical protein